MKETDINRIISSAFGELSQADEAQLLREAQADPELAKELAQYRAMMGDLPLLNDIPECQMSSDRLRDAIFAQPAPARPVLSLWSRPAVWAPLAVAACALAAVLVFRPSNSTSHIDLVNPGPVAIEMHKAPTIPKVDARPSEAIPDITKPQPMITDAGADQGDVEDIAPAPVVHHHHVTHHSASAPSREIGGSKAMAFSASSTPAGAFGGGALEASVKADTAAPALTDTVVVIGQNQDETGTPIATEIPKTNDLLISG